MVEWNRDIPLTPQQIRDYLVDNRYIEPNQDGTFTPTRFIAPLEQEKILIVAKDYEAYRRCMRTRNLDRRDCVYATNADVARRYKIKEIIYYGDFCAMPNATQVIRELERLWNRQGGAE